VNECLLNGIVDEIIMRNNVFEPVDIIRGVNYKH